MIYSFALHATQWKPQYGNLQSFGLLMFPCQEIKFNIIQSWQFKTSDKFLPSLVILKVSALGLYQDFWVKVFILIPQIQFSIVISVNFT